MEGSWFFCNFDPVPCNLDSIVVLAWATCSLNGLFQPRKIRTPIITSSANSRIICETGRKGRVRAMEIVKSLHFLMDLITRLERLRLLRKAAG